MRTEADEPWVFFYGSYINFEVLREIDLVPRSWEVATAAGFDLRIAPRANLVPSSEHTVWGINATATHEQLARLYRDHARGILGQSYLPFAILTRTVDGALRPTLTYRCLDMVPATADDAYVERILVPARAFGFPDWYLRRIAVAARRGER